MAKFSLNIANFIYYFRTFPHYSLRSHHSTLTASTPTPPTRGNSTNITTPIINPTNTTFFYVVPVSLSHTLPRWTSIGWRRYFFLHRRLYYLLGMETPTARGCRLISLWLCRIQDNHNSFQPIMDIFPVS